MLWVSGPLPPDSWRSLQRVTYPQLLHHLKGHDLRTAWEAIYRLLERGPAPPPVYQGQYDPRSLFAALKVFISG